MKTKEINDKISEIRNKISEKDNEIKKIKSEKNVMRREIVELKKQITINSHEELSNDTEKFSVNVGDEFVINKKLYKDFRGFKYIRLFGVRCTEGSLMTVKKINDKSFVIGFTKHVNNKGEELKREHKTRIVKDRFFKILRDHSTEYQMVKREIRLGELLNKNEN